MPERGANATTGGTEGPRASARGMNSVDARPGVSGRRQQAYFCNQVPSMVFALRISFEIKEMHCGSL